MRQCQLLDVNRSSYYYTPTGESEYNRLLIRLLDEQYTKNALLWQSKNDCLAAKAGLSGQSQAY